MSAIAELIQSAGVPFSRTPKRLRDLPVTLDKERRVELETVLHLRDGFRALGGALFVRPTVDVGSVAGIEAWNRLSGWRKPYSKASELLFFADDVFGHGFALYRDAVVRFDPERGTFDHYAFKLEAWAARVLAERADLGEAELVAWREAGHSELSSTDRLQPARPRVVATGQRVEFIKRNDEDLARRYARLFREIAANDGLAAGLSLDWWAEDDFDEPPAAAPLVDGNG